MKTLAFFKEVICDDNEERYRFLLNWLSELFQNKSKRNDFILVLKGEQGSGKSFFVKIICELLDIQHNNTSHFITHNLKYVVDRFSIILNEIQLLVLEEIFWNKDSENILHKLSLRKLKMIIVVGGYDWIPIKGSFVVFDVTNKRRGYLDYFKAINEELNNGGTYQLVKFLELYKGE